MSSTYTLKLHSRRVLVGESDGPQGADGVPELARTAYADMASSTWTLDGSAPSMPVHEFDRSRPSGDAWKAVWGYDKAGRSQRGACGAVCYTFLVPSDAVDQTSPCTLDSVSLSVRGDRYLDQGAVVTLVNSSSAEPPAWADVLAASIQSDPVCATSDQTVAPNKREAESADVELQVGAAPARYLHVVVRLQDYLGVRDAWIEGGAMLASGSVEATFSRSVSPDPDGPRPGVLRSMWRPGSVNIYGTQATSSDLRGWQWATWRGCYTFCSSASKDWSSNTAAEQLRTADERMRIPTAERLLDTMVGVNGVGIPDPRGYLVDFTFDTAVPWGYQVTQAGPSGSQTTRHAASIAYFAIEGDLGKGAVRGIRSNAALSPVYSDALVAGYFIPGRTVFSVADTFGTGKAGTWKALVPTAEAFGPDACQFGGATSMHVYGSFLMPAGHSPVHASVQVRYLGITGDAVPTELTDGMGPPPKTIGLQPLFTALVPKGASETVFTFDQPLNDPGWGTLVLFVSPTLTAAAAFGDLSNQTWNPTSITCLNS